MFSLKTIFKWYPNKVGMLHYRPNLMAYREEILSKIGQSFEGNRSIWHGARFQLKDSKLEMVRTVANGWWYVVVGEATITKGTDWPLIQLPSIAMVYIPFEEKIIVKQNEEVWEIRAYYNQVVQVKLLLEKM